MIYEYWLAGIKEITDLKKQKKIQNLKKNGEGQKKKEYSLYRTF